jgi:hypothetical protein
MSIESKWKHQLTIIEAKSMREELVPPLTFILTSEKRDTWHKPFTSLAIAQLNQFMNILGAKSIIHAIRVDQQ